MKFLITSIIISILLTAVIFALVTSKRKKDLSVSKKSYSLCLLGLLGFLYLLTGSFTRVEANQVGIIYDELRGGVQDETYGEGLHKKSIFESITEISTANRSASLKTTGQTNDGQYATFQLSLIYKIKTEDAGKFYRVANTTNVPSEALSTMVKSCLQSSTIKYDIFALLSTGLETARIDFKNDLSETLYQEYFVTLVDVSFDDIDGGTDVETILQEKAESEQKIKIAEHEAAAALITANNQAEIEKTLADAAAYAVRVEGEASGQAANAYANKVAEMIDSIYDNMNGTITYQEAADLVLSIVFYDNWNGVLPETLTSDSLSAMIGALISNKKDSTGSSSSGSGD